MRLKKKSDSVAVLTELKLEAYFHLLIAAAFLFWVVAGRELNGIATIFRQGGAGRLIWVSFLLIVLMYRLLLDPVRELRKPSLRLDKDSGWILRGSEQLAAFHEVDAVQTRTILGHDGGSLRVSLVMKGGPKVFLFHGSGGRRAEGTAAAIAEFLGVELRRKSGDPWKDPVAESS